MAYRNDVDALATRASALGLEVQTKSEEVKRAAALLYEARERAKLPVLDNLAADRHEQLMGAVATVPAHEVKGHVGLQEQTK